MILFLLPHLSMDVLLRNCIRTIVDEEGARLRHHHPRRRRRRRLHRHHRPHPAARRPMAVPRIAAWRV